MSLYDKTENECGPTLRCVHLEAPSDSGITRHVIEYDINHKVKYELERKYHTMDETAMNCQIEN